MTSHSPVLTRRLAPVAAVGAALAILLAACGSSATPTPPPDAKTTLETSATSLAALKFVHVDVDLSGTLTNPTPSAGSPATITLDGTKLSMDIDLANKKGTASLAIPAGLGGSAGAITADAIVAGDIYIKAPALLNTDKWMQIPSTLLSSMVPGGLSSALPSPSAGAAGGQLGSLLSMNGVTVTSQGTDACADGTCNKTAITIPAAVLQQAMSAAASGASAAAGLSGLGSLGSLGDANVTIWTAASNGRFNKATLALSFGSTGTFTVSVTLSKFDQPITVTVPPADQTQPFSLGG